MIDKTTTEKADIPARPAILMNFEDSEALAKLARTAEAHLPQVSAMLLDEIERADIRDDASLPADVVTMGATVVFADDGSKTQRTVKLVYPGDADIAAGRISILAPVGAGLIGLREGQSILWPDRSGKSRRLRILKVSRPR